MPCRGRLLPPPGDQCGSAGEGSWAQCYPEKKALIIGDRGSTRAQEIAREDVLPLSKEEVPRVQQDPGHRGTLSCDCLD